MAEEPKNPGIKPGAVKLVVAGGPGPAAAYVLGDAPLRIGRVPGNEVVVNEAAVSSKHAEFQIEDGFLVVRDLGSRNGLFVNGNRVLSSAVTDGDVVRLGSHVTVTVEIPSMRK